MRQGDAHPMTRRCSLQLWPALAALWFAGCASPLAEPMQLEAPAALVDASVRFQKEYLLAPGDTMDIVVWKIPELTRTVMVRPDGMISLPLLQDVKAAGLSARELAQQLTQALSARLIKPEVNVVPVQVRQPAVFVFGDVSTPGAVPLRSAATALQAITLAGGLRRSGAEADVSIVRLNEAGQLQVIPVPAKATGQAGKAMSLGALSLQADDIVFVPENDRSQVSRFLDDFILKPLQTVLTYKLIRQ
jgi:polysaccharide biosynthesis/export protein